MKTASRCNRPDNPGVICSIVRLKFVLTAAGAIAFAGVSLLAWQQHGALAALRAQAGNPAERASMSARIEALRKRNADLERQLAAATAGNAVETAPDSASETTGGAAAVLVAAEAPVPVREAGGGARKDGEFELLATLSNLPEFQQLLALQQRAGVDAKYAALFRRLKLAPEAQQQLARLLADKQSAFADAMLAAHEQGLSGREARSTATRVARATTQEIDASVKTLLGEQAYKQYQFFERTMPQRETVNQLAQRLSYTSTPLTAQQQEQLVRTLATSSRPNGGAKGGTTQARQAGQPARTVAPLPNAFSGLGIKSTSKGVITANAVTKAQTFLSAAQVSALADLQQEQKAQQALGQLVRSPKPRGPKPGKG